MSGWDTLMGADKIAVPHHRWEQAVGFANARAESRGSKQRMYRRDVNERSYWAITDARVTVREAAPALHNTQEEQ